MGSKKDALVSNITIAYENTKVNIEVEKENEISIEKRRNDIEAKQISEKKIELEQEKSILNQGIIKLARKDFFHINKEIEKNSLERKTLEQSFILRKFWNVGNSPSYDWFGYIYFLFICFLCICRP